MSTAFKQHTDNAVAYIAVSGALNNTTNPVTISLASGKGALFASPGNGQYVTIWDKVSYPDPGDDPAMEKAVITARTTDSITLSRPSAVAHAGTPAIAELPRTLHFTDIEGAVNTAETGLATAQSNITTLQTTVAGKSAVIFDAIVATSGGDYTTIGAAFAAGKFRLRIMPGTYTETDASLNTYTISGKDIYLEGIDKKNTTLMLWDNVSGTFSFKATTTIKNITLACPTTATYPTLNATWYNIAGQNVTIENCNLMGTNTNSSAYFFYCTASQASQLNLINCSMTRSHGGNSFVYADSYGRLLIDDCVFDLEIYSPTSSRSLVYSQCYDTTIVNSFFRGGIDQTSYPWIYTASGAISGFQNITIANNICNRTYTQFCDVNTLDGNIIFSNNIIKGYSTTNGNLIRLRANNGGEIACIGNNIRVNGAKNTFTTLEINVSDMSTIIGNIIKNSTTNTSLKGLYVINPNRCSIIGNHISGFSTTSSVGLETNGSGTYTVIGNTYYNNTTDYTLTGTPIVNFNGTLQGDTTTTAPTTTAGMTVTNRYGGDTNVLGDPVGWMPIKIGATTYKIPMYT